MSYRTSATHFPPQNKKIQKEGEFLENGGGVPGYLGRFGVLGESDGGMEDSLVGNVGSVEESESTSADGDLAGESVSFMAATLELETLKVPVVAELDQRR